MNLLRRSFLTIASVAIAGFLAVSTTKVEAESPSLLAKPTRHFSDQTGTISAEQAKTIDDFLVNIEQKTSAQILVYLTGGIPGNRPMEEVTVKAAREWGVGQKEKNNGAVLFIFKDARKMRFEVGYGLEGALPDLVTKEVLDTQLTPNFKQGNFYGGIVAAVNSIAPRLEKQYNVPLGQIASLKGSLASANNQANAPPKQEMPLALRVFLIVIAIVLFVLYVFLGGGSSSYGGGYSSGGSWGGGSSGSSSRGSSGGFSGGGGRSGGGGSSGSW